MTTEADDKKEIEFLREKLQATQTEVKNLRAALGVAKDYLSGRISSEVELTLERIQHFETGGIIEEPAAIGSGQTIGSGGQTVG